MANITFLHWNIEQLGEQKFKNHQDSLITYIVNLINSVNADIVSILEVKNAQSPWVAYRLIELLGDTKWGGVKVNSKFNSEEYLLLYRTDRAFKPIVYLNGTVQDSAYPERSLINKDINDNIVAFQSRLTSSGGRLPFYATFRTTDTNKRFSVLAYHAMFNTGQTQIGVKNISKVFIITRFYAPTLVPIDASLISGDFNLDFNDNRIDYKDLLAFSSNAVSERTSLASNPSGLSNNPKEYRANAYDNIFQKPAQPAPTPPAERGAVIDLMVQSSVYAGVPPPSPPNAADGTGYLSQAAGAFNIKIINEKLKYIDAKYAIVSLPPTAVPTSWDFVREVISDHYPVVVTTPI